MDLGRIARCALGCSLIAGYGSAFSLFAYAEEERDGNDGNIREIPHAVPHLSTQGANSGEFVNLFVRELVRKSDGDDGDDKHRPRKAVLMIHGRTVPALAVFDLQHKNYSWARELAKAGFDVFIVDLQGSGKSPLPNRSLAPMTDACNVTAAQQQRFLLAPNPPFLAAPCAASFPFLLVNSQSEWDETDTVVDYIIAKRRVEKVALVAISRGSLVAGPYAVLHPEKVESLFLQGPIFNPLALPGIGDGLAPPVRPAGQLSDLSTRFVPCTRAEITSNKCPGISPNATRPHRILPPLTAAFPAAMALATREDFITRLHAEAHCDGQVEEGLQDRIWKSIMDNDKLGSGWGPSAAGAPPNSAPEGLMRNRSFFPWGWTPPVARRVRVPTLVVFGELDTEGTVDGFPVAVNSFLLYDTIPGAPGVAKLLFKVACTGHQMFWEGQRKVLHRLSKQWLKHGAIDGNSNGKFFIDTEGNSSPIN
jgi:pimeloyl-ACP methyl ester carboxylesterase